jgi:hypothetical protein
VPDAPKRIAIPLTLMIIAPRRRGQADQACSSMMFPSGSVA